MKGKDSSKAECDKIIEGLEKAYVKLLEFKKQKKTPFVISRNGKVVEVAPEDMPPFIKYRRGAD